jgi:hypothetical protein
MLDATMPHGFDAYRVFISAPGDLEPDRQVCHDILTQINESIAMPAKLLLVAIGLRDNNQITGSRSIVSDNVRWSTFFIQLFQDDWGPRDLFRKLFLLAAECRDDASMPMRGVVVCLKDAPDETSAEILAFREELAGRKDLRILRYGSVDELKEQLAAVCQAWAQELIASRPNGASPA